MKILCVDIGTGTQDILLYDSDREIENCLKMVMPSPTLLVAQQVKQATHAGKSIVLSGVIMGGGPCHWAVKDHIKAGCKVYATPEAAQTFDDELDKVEAMGIRVVSEDEARRIDEDEDRTIRLRDFDLDMIRAGFAAFGVELQLDGLALAVFDHGNAPAGYSDRQFRFDYLEQRLRAQNSLAAFAHTRGQVPEHLTRLRAVDSCAADFEGEVLLMDTAPAAVLGAMLDPKVAVHEQCIVANVGNFHTLAFRLGRGGIDGVFEHHTGEITREQLDGFIARLMAGTLEHGDVFDSLGHGALLFDRTPMADRFVAVVGPRRSMMHGSAHHPYFAVPLGDMMLAGCFGLLRAFAGIAPERSELIAESLRGTSRPAPWALP